MSNYNLKTNPVIINADQFWGVYENALINPGMEITQRGNYTAKASYATDDRYFLDRWIVGFAAGVTDYEFQQLALTSGDPWPACQCAAKLEVSSTHGSGWLYMIQKIEAYKSLLGKTVTLSCWARANANYSLWYGNNAANYFGTTLSGTGTWQRITQTWVIDSADQVFLAFGVRLIDCTNASNYVDTTGWVLNIGSEGIAYKPRHLTDELRLCQRYYEKSYNQGTVPGTNPNTVGATMGIAANTTEIAGFIWQVTKYSIPTLTIISKAGASATCNLTDSHAEVNAMTYADHGEHGVAKINRGGGVTKGNGYFWNWTAESEM